MLGSFINKTSLLRYYTVCQPGCRSACSWTMHDAANTRKCHHVMWLCHGTLSTIFITNIYICINCNVFLTNICSSWPQKKKKKKWWILSRSLLLHYNCKRLVQSCVCSDSSFDLSPQPFLLLNERLTESGINGGLMDNEGSWHGTQETSVAVDTKLQCLPTCPGGENWWSRTCRSQFIGKWE